MSFTKFGSAFSAASMISDIVTGCKNSEKHSSVIIENLLLSYSYGKQL